MFGSDRPWEREGSSSGYPGGETAGAPPQDGSAAPFRRKAAEIANQLHHPDVRIAHLLLAIALSRRAEEYLTIHGLKADVVRRCCWRALEGIVPVDDMANDPNDLLSSTEVNDLLLHASTFSNGQELQVTHVLRAVTDAKLVGQLGSLVRNPEPRPEEMDVKVSAIKACLDKELPDIARRLDTMETQHGTFAAQMLDLRGNVGSGVREGDLHKAMTGLRTYTTTLKYIVIISAVALAFVTAMIRIVGGP
jgi:hypothetical protein